VLGIDVNGQYFLDKKAVPNEQLGDILKRIYDARTSDKILYLKAHKDLKYEKIVDALDIAAKSGVRVTGMISDQLNNTKSVVEGDNLGDNIKKGKP